MKPLTEKTLVLAYRGASAYAPERSQIGSESFIFQHPPLPGSDSVVNSLFKRSQNEKTRKTPPKSQDFGGVFLAEKERFELYKDGFFLFYPFHLFILYFPWFHSYPKLSIILSKNYLLGSKMGSQHFQITFSYTTSFRLALSFFPCSAFSCISIQVRKCYFVTSPYSWRSIYQSRSGRADPA